MAFSEKLAVIMTRQILIFISIIFLFSCNDNDINDMNKRNENWAYWVDSITGEASWVPVGPETTLKDGRYTLFYSNGKTYEKGKLKDGKNKDTIYCFDLNENIIKYKLIKEDTLIQYYLNDGPYSAYFQNCKVLEKGVVKNHDRGNEWTRYFKNGNIEWIEKLENNTGLTVWYHDNGQMWDSTYHINGQGHGLIKHWYPNGQIEEIANWDNGIQNGFCEKYYENGKPKEKSNWVNGMRVGDVTEWYSNGNIKSTANYILGQAHGKAFQYNENGKLLSEGSLENGKQVGKWHWYYDNGKLKQIDTYVDGQLVDVEK